MDPIAPENARLRRALRQRLESLQRAGVECLPRCELPDALPTTAAEPIQGNVLPVAQTEAGGNRHPDAGHAPLSNSTPSPQPAINSTPPTPSVGDMEAMTMPRKSRSPITPEPTQPTRPAKKLSLAAKQEQLAALCDQVKSCRLCPDLVQNRTQTVFGVGNPNTRLCFFGEAPGADEDQQGEPFVGRAGQLLDKIIEACTLRRKDIYILNTVKCRPPGNRNPEPDEISNCRPFFEQQLELIRPEFICCLGLVSATALLDTKLSISKLRGRLHPWRWAKVLVTYHPAYLLRNPNAKKDVWEDMKFLMREMGIEL